MSYPKANNTPNKQPATQKVTLDARESRKQGPPTKDPVQHDLVDRFTPSRDPPKRAAPPKREAEAMYPPQHAGSALKNMSVERGKARLAVRGPLDKADAASRTLSKAPTPLSPTSVSKPSTTANDERPDHYDGTRHHPHRLDALQGKKTVRARAGPARKARHSAINACRTSRTRAATASRASSSRTASRPPGRRAAAEQSRFGPRAAPPGVRHAGLAAGPRAVCGVCGGRADPGTQSAPPGARPGRRASAPQVARLGVEKRLLRGAAGRAQRRAAPGAAPAGPAPGPRGGGGVAAAGGAHGGVLGVSGPPGRAAR